MKKIFQYLAGNLLLILLLVTGCNRNPSQQGGEGIDATDSAVSTTESSEQGPPSQPLPPEQREAAEDALRQAALDGMTQQVKMLLASGVDPDVADPDGHTPLMLSAFNGHSAIVLELIAGGALVDRKDQLGRTALLYAATGPFPETVKILLDKGADPNIVDAGEHFTPLMHAAAEGNLDVVRILVESGADPALRDVDNDDAETFAREAGHLEVAELLHNLR